MTFNVADFSSKLGREGLARTNVFLVKITTPPALAEHIGGQELQFFCKTVDLPSMGINVQDHMAQGFGRVERRPTGINFEPVPAIFMLDSNHKVLKFFHAWMQSTVNYDISAGGLSEVDGRLPYEIAYKNEYCATMEIHFFSPGHEDKYYTYKLENVHPINVGSLSLSWENNDEIATLPVSFSYDAIKVDGSRSGVVTGGLNRGAGLFEYVSSLNSYVQAISNLRKPNSIQDLINQYTSVSTIFSTLF